MFKHTFFTFLLHLKTTSYFSVLLAFNTTFFVFTFVSFEFGKEIHPMVNKFFQKVSPLYKSLDQAFDHRNQECQSCKDSSRSYCEEGYVYFDRNHHSYSSTRDSSQAKSYDPSKVLEQIALDLVEGIDHTEKEGFSDKEFKENYNTWNNRHEEYINEKEKKFKQMWDRRDLKRKVELEEDMKAASGSKLERPRKLRRTRQTRSVSQETSDSSSEEEESDDSSVDSVYSDSSN